MLTEKGNIVINQKPALNAEDYDWLRKTGLSYIQQFSGKVWSDYNLHDPGITILELLCYALTDLEYRRSLPIADLLTAEGQKGPLVDDFFTARQILTIHPITEQDFRKLILDRIPGIRNIWLETLDKTDYSPTIFFDKKTVATTLEKPPVAHQFEILQLKGLYVVKLEVEEFEIIQTRYVGYLTKLAQYRDKDSPNTGPQADATEYKTCLANFVKTMMLDSRNLCEDFNTVKVADEEWVALCADIELKPNANADIVFLEINNLLYNYVNPSLRLYSFKELVEKGKKTEDIFNGPAAARGFIDDDELARHGHKEVLFVSDIINLLMDIDGVLQIKKIHLTSYTKDSADKYTIIEDAQRYCLHLKDKANSVFRFILDADEQDKKKLFNHIHFSKGPIYFTPVRKPEYKKLKFIAYPQIPLNFQNDLAVPQGKNRNLLNYFSMQNDFPLCYYTGMDGIPNGETTLRKAQRLQTKAFLLFFDQVLADYLAQLDNLKNVFTWRGGPKAPTLVPLSLNENIIKDLRKLLASEQKEDAAVKDNVFFKSTYDSYKVVLESPDEIQSRRNRVLDHMLARFNELFTDYTIFKFQQNKQGDFFYNTETINDKIQFLKLYPIISSKRSHAFNYTKGLYAADNTSGLQLRLQKMLGLVSAQNKALVTPLNAIDYKVLLDNIVKGKKPAPAEKIVVTDNRFSDFDKVFGLHVLEHILLRPLFFSPPNIPAYDLLSLCGSRDDNPHTDCLLPDNYSMQLSVVLPGWLAISSNMDFRTFAENLIRTEAPAHAALKICWLDPARMFLFEKTTEAFFIEMAKIKVPGTKPTDTDKLNYNKALQDVYAMMGVLQNMYPPSKLDECENINYNAALDQIKTPVILNYSALGSSAGDEWYQFNNAANTINKPLTRLTGPLEKSEDQTTDPPANSPEEKAIILSESTGLSPTPNEEESKPPPNPEKKRGERKPKNKE